MVLELMLVKNCTGLDSPRATPTQKNIAMVLSILTLLFILWVILVRARKCGEMAGPGLAPLHIVAAVVAPFWYWLSTTFMWGGQACA